MSDTAPDITPTGPAQRVNNSGSQDKQLRSSVYGKWEIGGVNPLANKPELGITGHTKARLNLSQEYNAYNVLETLYGVLENPHTGKDLSQMAEVIKERFPYWDKRAQDLILLKMDQDDLKLLEELKGDWAGAWEALVDQKKRQFIRYKRTGSPGLEKDIKKRKERISSVLSLPEADNNKKLALIQEIRQQYKWYGVSNEDIEKRLQAYVNKEDQHIFETVDELMYVYQFAEQAEKSISYQLGYDLTTGGTRDITIDMSDQQISKLVEKETDPRKIAAYKDIGRRVALNNWDDFWDWAGIAIMTGGGAYVGAFNDIYSNSILGSMVDPSIAGRLDTLIGAGGGLLATFVYRATTRRIRSWWFKIPEGGQPERATRFTLSFNPGNLHDPALRDIGDTENPIRQLFQGKGDEAGLFLQKCEDFRSDLANGFYFHSPETLAGWMDLSDRVLGEAAQGTEMRHRIRLAKKIQQILEQEYKREAGGHKELGELELEDRVKVVTKAFDTISQVEGGETLAPIIKKVMIARARGEPLEEGITSQLEKLAKDILSGARVLHPKESPITLENKEHELSTETARRERQTTSKESYTQLLTDITTQESTATSKKDAWDSAKTTKGKQSAGAKKATGEIGTIEAKIKTAEDRITFLKSHLGEKQATGLYTGIIGDQKQIGGELKAAKKIEAGTEKILAERSEELQRLKLIPLDLIPDTDSRKQEIIDKIAILDSDVDPRGAKAAENALTPLTERRESLEESYNSLGNEINNVKQEIAIFEKSGGTLDNLRDQIETKKNEIETARLEYKSEKDKLDALIRKRNQLLQEVFGFDVTIPGFTAPSTEKIGDIAKETADKVTKLEAELKKLRERKEAGEALVVSDEDKETERGLQKLVESEIFNSDKFNELINDIISGNIKIEDLAKTLSDEGYNLLLKRIFGIDALSQGVNGNYNLTSRILSKGRLAEAIMSVWNLENRATPNAFFAGDSAGLQAYQDSQSIKQEIAGLTEQVSNIEKGKADGWEDQVRDLRRQLNNIQIELNDSLSILYDTRLASLLAQDRVSTAQVISKTLIEISKDAIKGNPFNELLTVSTAGPKTETFTTDHGPISITEMNKNERTGALIERGPIIEENIGNSGISVNLGIDNTEPIGGLNLTLNLRKEQSTINLLPSDLQPNIPDELVYLAYGNEFRRKAATNPADFDQAVLDSITYTNRESAENAGLPPELINIIYGPNTADGKKDLADIITGLGAFNPAVLPYERESFIGASPELQALFYELTADKRRTVVEINNFISSLAVDRAAATAAGGYPPGVLELIYKADGTRKDPSEIQNIIFKRDPTQIADLNQLVNLFNHVDSTRNLTRNFLFEVAQGISMMNVSDRIRHLQNKFTDFNQDGFEVKFDNGELNVYFVDPVRGRLSSGFADILKISPTQADRVDPAIVAHIQADPNRRIRLITRFGGEVIEAKRKVV